jgi:uncharacterized protein YdhG (YjbR/CyaY superfamily)
MKDEQPGPGTVDEYIATFPAEVQELLQKIRQTIRSAAPQAIETISYQMPAYMLNGGLLSFAAWKTHIAIYPAPQGDEQFNAELSLYKTEKSTVRFPLDKPIPYDLIRKIVEIRVKNNLEKAESKQKKK